MNYIWKITMNNGEAYYIQNNIKDVNEMLELSFRPNNINTWKLFPQKLFDENTDIAIRNDDILTIEYKCD